MTSRYERKRLRALYEARFATTAQILRAWNPYRLLELGAPLDELDDEITRVVARWDELRSPKDGARVIAEVFSSAFDPRDFSVESCLEIGERLFAAKESAGEAPGAQEVPPPSAGT